METRKIAGITFTATGITIEKPYQKNVAKVTNKVDESVYTDKYLKIMKNIVKSRMAHCFKKLHENLATAPHVTHLEIAWKGGHFSVPVWTALEEALNLTDVRHLNILQSQQIIRAMLENNCGSWAYDYDDSWERIPNSDVQVTKEFITFITEHIVVQKWHEEHH